MILTSRNQAKGEAAVETLQAENLDVVEYSLDVTDPDSIKSLAESVRTHFGRLDILVNNAGLLLDASVSSLLDCVQRFALSYVLDIFWKRRSAPLPKNNRGLFN